MKILKHILRTTLLLGMLPSLALGQDLTPYIYGKASIGDVNGLRNLKASGISLDVTDAGGNTAYCLAVSRRNQTAIWALQQAGVNTNPSCLTGFSVVTERMIYRAASRQDADLLKRWQAQGINVDTMDSYSGNTALCQAVYEQDCKAIDLLLKAGASEYHMCMRRVPESVRQALDCRPVVINWSKVGMAVLGAGVAGGAIAIAVGGGGGSKSGIVCAANQHWENGACVSCPAGKCWTGTQCRETKVNEYKDPATDRCMEIAPSPYAYSTIVAEEFNTDEYKTGRFLQYINAADAYARGYSGYIVPRISQNPFGALVNEQQKVSDDNTPVDSSKDFTTTHNNGRVRVGVLSTGTYIQDITTSDSSGSGTETNSTDLRRVNRDLAYPEGTQQTQTVTNPDTTTTEISTTTATGKWLGNLATNESGKLIGYNFDIGFYSDSKQQQNSMGVNLVELQWGDETYMDVVPACLEYDIKDEEKEGKHYESIVITKENIWNTKSYASKSIYYTSGTKMYFLGAEKETVGEEETYKYDNDTNYLVLYDASKTRCGAQFCGLNQNYNYVPLECCTATGDTMCFSPPDVLSEYKYDDDYVLTGNETNPNPHYQINQSGDMVSPKNGTALAGIIAALRNGLGMHGVAYNAEVVPAIADIVLPVSKNAIQTLVNDGGASIIVQDLALKSVGTSSIASYAKGKTMEAAFGTSAANGYKYAADKNVIYIVGTGDNALNTFVQSSPTSIPYITLAKDVYGTDPTTGEPVLTTDNSFRRDATLSAGVPLTNNSTLAGVDKIFMAVTSVMPYTYNDENGKSRTDYVLPVYAQPCGSASGYCLSAPGGAGYSSLSGGGSCCNATGDYCSPLLCTSTSASSADATTYGYPSIDEAKGNGLDLISTGIAQNTDYKWGDIYGTSSAASVVAGAAAVLKGAYPHLTSSEIVSILFQTATPLGACAGIAGSDDDTCVHPNGNDQPGYSTLYGWGLVNLDKATQPVGALWVNGGSNLSNYLGANYLPASGITTSSVMSQNVLNALPASFTAFDSYNRPFSVNTNSFVTTRSVRKEFDKDFKAFINGRDVTKVKPNDQFTMAYAPRTSYRSSELPTGLMEMNVDLGKSNFGFYYTEDTMNSRGNYIERSLNNPFIQMQEAYGVELHHNLTSNLSVGVNYASGKNGFLGDGDRHHKAPDNTLSMVSTDAAYQLTKSVVFKTSYGVMKEDDSVLGMMGEGAFKINGASTNFVSAGVEFKPTDHFKLNLAYTYGWTKPETSGLMSLSRLTSDGFAAVAQYDLSKDTVLGFSISSPLRVRSGQVSFDLPVGRSSTDDTVYRQTFTGSMKPTAREFDFALYYKDALTEALSIQSELGLRLNPDHQKDATPDYRAMMGLKWIY